MKNRFTKVLLAFVLVFALVIAAAPVVKAEFPAKVHVDEPEAKKIEVKEGEDLYNSGAYFPDKADLDEYEPFGEVGYPWEHTWWPGEFSADVYDKPAKEDTKCCDEKPVEKKNPPTGDAIIVTELVLAAAAAGYVQLSKKDR